MKPLSEISSLDQYVSLFSDALADKVRSHCEPLHDPAKAPRHPRLSEITTPLFDKQADVVTGCVESLKANRLAILGCQMGTGKTPQGIATCHCHADGKPYRVLILCPPHLCKKWVREITEKFLKGKARAVHIQSWQQFLELRYEEPPKVPTFFVMAMTTAKLGSDRRSAALEGAAWFRGENGQRQKRTCLKCPRCAFPAFTRKKLLASKEDIEKGWLHCTGNWCKACGKSCTPDHKKCPECDGPLRTCGEALWQMCSHKIDPAFFAKARMTKVPFFDYLIRDEAHGSKSSASIDGNALAVFANAARYTILMTGTLLAGKSEDIRPMLFRLKPRTFVDLGFGWKDEIPFAQRYGRIQTVVRTTEGSETKRRTGKGSSKSTNQSVKPGILPQLYPEIIANYTTFLSLTDIAVNLPPYLEETIPIPMDATMRAHYDHMKNECLAAFRQLYHSNRKVAMKLLGPMLEALLTWPDVPYDRKAVGWRDEDDGYHIVHNPANMDRTMVYPKEQKLIDLVQKEKAQGRKCWVYSVRDDTRDRLQDLLERHGMKVAHLQATVKTTEREAWIAKQGPKCDVGLCHPALVETGLELFGPGFNFPTLVWYSTGFQLNTLRQASRRSWRIGQMQACRTVYLYYDDSAQEQAISVMASKLVAAEAIEGKFSEGGLADESCDEDIALTVARNLADNIRKKPERLYKPVETVVTPQERLQMIRAKIAMYREKFKVA